MIGLKVIADSYERVTRYADGDRWDREDTYTSWSINGIKISKEREYKDLAADFEVNPGDTVYLLYAIYSTGDSFGHDENGGIDYISVHKNKELAEQNREFLLQNPKLYETINIQTDTGIIIPYYRPWLGYFESLSILEVLELKVT